MPRRRIKFHDKGWDEVVKKVIDDEGVPRMQRVADMSNAYIETDGYKVSTEGDKQLGKRSFRATVITANLEAIEDNAHNNRLIQNLHLAGGEG